MILFYILSAVPRHIFILLNWYGCPKNEPKFLKPSPIFLALNSLITVHFNLIILWLCLVVWHWKAAKQSHNFYWSVWWWGLQYFHENAGPGPCTSMPKKLCIWHSDTFKNLNFIIPLKGIIPYHTFSFWCCSEVCPV